MEETKTYLDNIRSEYERLEKIFEEGAPEQIKLLDGVFLETARIKAELDNMAALVMLSGGRVRFNPKNPKQQEVLPVSRELEKARASYANYMFRLSRALGINTDDEEDEMLSEYE